MQTSNFKDQSPPTRIIFYGFKKTTCRELVTRRHYGSIMLSQKNERIETPINELFILLQILDIDSKNEKENRKL